MKTCRPRHTILLAETFTPMGAFVSCLACGDSFHIREASLHDHYYHAHHVSGEGIFGKDRDFFILEDLVDERRKP